MVRCYIFLFLQHTVCVQKISKPNFVVFIIESIDQITNLIKPEENRFSNELVPNIRQLLKESTSFTNMYGESSSVSSFASFLTGKPAVDLGIIRGKLLPFDSLPSPASSGGLSESEETIPKRLRAAGYRTWFSGYWKLGLGQTGEIFPMNHGFDTWFGIVHPNSEWCHRKKQSSLSLLSKSSFNPYVNLFYKASFLWAVVITFLTTVMWLRFIMLRLYINLLIYTFGTSIAFYILLHLFIMQRTASCVLYYHDEIYQQPYEMNNLTLHFTQHSTRLIDVVAEVSPFFMVLNYMNLRPPLFSSGLMDRSKTSDPWSNAVIELDWSIGKVMQKLEETNVFDNTVIILTGNNDCKDILHNEYLMNGFERIGENIYQQVEGKLFYYL